LSAIGFDPSAWAAEDNGDGAAMPQSSASVHLKDDLDFTGGVFLSEVVNPQAERKVPVQRQGKW
jgi:hypothetical protein